MSFARRATLAKAVIESIPMYHMMNCVAPKTCMKEIQRIQRGFICGDTEIEKQIHTVRYENISNPMNHGVLGMGKLVGMDNTCLPLKDHY